MTSIAPHLSLAELEQRYRGATAAIEKSHYHAIWLRERRSVPLLTAAL